MRYAFTGPSALTGPQRAFCEIELGKLTGATEWTTGAAYGLDSLAHIAGERRTPRPKTRIVVPAAPHNEQLVANLDADELIFPHHPEGASYADAYRVRNTVMVRDYADVLVAFLRQAVFYRSGEWMTVNIARKLGVPVRELILP